MKLFSLFYVSLVMACAPVLAASTKSKSSQQPAPSNQPPMVNEGPDCTQLTPDQQNFAYQITDMKNREAFCTQFNKDQRQQVMQMTGQPDVSGKKMTADQAVQSVMKTSKMAPSQNPPAPRKGGACPVN